MENHLHLPAQRLQLVPRQSGDIHHIAVFRAEENLPGGRIVRAQDAARGRRLATAGLADERQRFALVDVERHIVHRAHLRDDFLQNAAANRKKFAEVFDVEKDLVVGLVHGMLPWVKFHS